jgi:hypothetical protein
MSPEDLLDLERDAERYRALDRHSAFGITARPNGREYLLYVHGCIASEMPPPIEASDLAECVDRLIVKDSRAKELKRSNAPTLPPPRNTQVTLPDRGDR